MRAAVLTQPHQIEILEIDSPKLMKPHDVLIEMLAVGLCGTDLGFWGGHRRPPVYPWVLGHEGVGRVNAVGDSVSAVRPGDLVAIEPNYPCNQCNICATGNTSLCTQRVSLGLNAPGLLSEHVVIPEEFVWHMPEVVSLQAAVCTEPLAVVMAGVRRAGPNLGSGSVLVVGAGPQGLLAVEVLRSLKIDTAVVEPQQLRLEYAYQLGARAPFNEERFQTIFETSGNGQGASAAMQRLAPYGVGVFIGVGEEPLTLDTKALVRGGLTVTGSMIYDHPEDFQATIDNMAQQLVRPERVLGTSYLLDDAHEAFDAAATQVGKSWIVFDPLVSTSQVGEE